MQTLEEIYQGLASDFTSRTGLAAVGSSELAVRFYAVAAQVYSLYVQAEWTLRQCFPQTAEGDYLDLHARLRNITRRQATAAVGTVRFFADAGRPGDTEVPAGTVCMTAGGFRFATREAGWAEAGGYVDVPVEAAEPGVLGNADAGTVVYMAVPPVGITACTNPQGFTGGQDGETDEELRERVLDSYRRLANGANTAFYQQTAMSFDGVAAVTVVPRSRGVGTVDVVVAAWEGMPGEELLQAIQAHLDLMREIAVDVDVLAPTERTVDVSVHLTAAPGQDPDQVKGAAEDALRAWFTGERLGRPVLRAELTALLFGVDGVANCQVTLPQADVTDVDTVTLPLLGQLTVTAEAG